MVFPSFSALLGVFCALPLALASIPSFGLQTTGGIRADLPDSAFRINPAEGTVVTTADFTVNIAELSNFPALAGQDVQSQIVRLNLKAGKSFIRHYHPRGAETLNAVRGNFKISFQFEGMGDARIVTNVIPAGESTVFPQGLIHDIQCISKYDCIFVSNFSSADPGFVPA